MNDFEFRPDQKDVIRQAIDVFQQSYFVYLAGEVRTGKTLVSFGIAQTLGVKKVTFVTKKKPIDSGTLEKDYQLYAPDFSIRFINFESIHKLPGLNWTKKHKGREFVPNYDLLKSIDEEEEQELWIIDEAHKLGAFPKPSKIAKQIKQILQAHRSHPAVILMSGTPTPESFCQFYHQVYGIEGNPFSTYKNFYEFAKDHVNTYEITIDGFPRTRYERGKDSINEAMQDYKISFTQEGAGFKTKVEETILEIPMPEKIDMMISRLKKDRVIEGHNEVILADGGSKLMSKVHQFCGGTIKFEPQHIGDKMIQNSMILDTSKAEYIAHEFEGLRLAIFYKFTEEYNAIKKIFGASITNDIKKWKASDTLHIALQIQAGREGISLSEADTLIYYNMDHAAVSYWQSRDRLTTKDKLVNSIFYIFFKGGIGKKIYDTVVNDKKDYTLAHFKQDFNCML